MDEDRIVTAKWTHKFVRNCGLRGWMILACGLFSVGAYAVGNDLLKSMMSSNSFAEAEQRVSESEPSTRINNLEQNPPGVGNVLCNIISTGSIKTVSSVEDKGGISFEQGQHIGALVRCHNVSGDNTILISSKTVEIKEGLRSPALSGILAYAYPSSMSAEMTQNFPSVSKMTGPLKLNESDIAGTLIYQYVGKPFAVDIAGGGALRYSMSEPDQYFKILLIFNKKIQKIDTIAIAGTSSSDATKYLLQVWDQEYRTFSLSVRLPKELDLSNYRFMDYDLLSFRDKLDPQWERGAAQRSKNIIEAALDKFGQCYSKAIFGSKEIAGRINNLGLGQMEDDIHSVSSITAEQALDILEKANDLNPETVSADHVQLLSEKLNRIVTCRIIGIGVAICILFVFVMIFRASRLTPDSNGR